MTKNPIILPDDFDDESERRELFELDDTDAYTNIDDEFIDDIFASEEDDPLECFACGYALSPEEEDAFTCPVCGSELTQ